jgi:AraC family transcriptional regulator
MDFLHRITEVINYIEEHLTDDFDFNGLAKIMCCDVYQFGRIFSYITGISLAEYIRNRRLSLAALDLQGGNVKVIDTAIKYGYSSSESFGRAFREMHGILPKEANNEGVTLKMYPRMEFQISIKGVVNMDYRIEEKGVIKCAGGTYHLAKGDDGWSNAWEKYLDIKDEKLGRTPNEVIRDKYKLYRAPMWQIGVAHSLEDGSLDMSIGAEIRDGEEYPEVESFEIPAATWAVFSGKGKVYRGLAALLTKIFTEWMPSSGYEQSMQYTIEIYPPGNSKSDDYAFEIWIPVKRNHKNHKVMNEK